MYFLRRVVQRTKQMIRLLTERREFLTPDFLFCHLSSICLPQATYSAAGKVTTMVVPSFTRLCKVMVP